MSRMGEYAFEHEREYEPMTNEQGEIAKALAAAQADMQNPSFDSQNPHFKSRFATLAAVRNSTVPVLAKHGISVTQDLQTTESGVACITTLTHASGQRMSFGPLVMPASKADAQGFGSAATYARRYSLMAVCCVVGDDDDDGNQAVASAPSGWAANPRGDLGTKIDTKVVNKWAKALIDQQDNPHRLVEVWDELKPDHDLATAVWSALPKAVKDRVKDARDAVA